MTNRTCTAPDCAVPATIRNLCGKHYKQQWRYGQFTTPRTPRDRILSKIDYWDDCWLWTGARAARGYGTVWSSRERRQVTARRYVYEVFVAPVADGYRVVRTCHELACVNPQHTTLVPVNGSDQGSRL